jgi:SAM-dependent methyltransferase
MTAMATAKEAFPSSTYHASDGAAYDRWLGRWAERLAELLLDFADFPETGEVIDVGCGTGALTLAMARRWPERGVLGVDLAEPFLEHARRQPSPNPPRFEVGDACQLRYADGAFAAAASQLVLMFIPRPERALAEIARVVRPGGKVVAALWDFRGGLIFQRLLWDTAAALDPEARATRNRLFSAPLVLPDGLTQLFRAQGLQDVERQSLTIRMEFADFADYWEPFLGGQGPVGAYFLQLAPELKARIKEAVRDAYLSGAADGPRSMTATAWAVRGRVP